jgi:predicted kinase
MLRSDHQIDMQFGSIRYANMIDAHSLVESRFDLLAQQCNQNIILSESQELIRNLVGTAFITVIVITLSRGLCVY